jgi:hypothetical protein
MASVKELIPATPEPVELKNQNTNSKLLRILRKKKEKSNI